LINLNNLPEKVLKKPIKITKNEEISFAIMIEFSEITKAHIIGRLFKKLNDILIQ
jgi:hypothetical protein